MLSISKFSLRVLTSLFVLSLISSPALAASRCSKEKGIVRTTKSKSKSAASLLGRQERLVASLARKVERDLDKVINLRAKQEQATADKKNQWERKTDRLENRRLALLADATELGLQAAACVGTGFLNGLLGTELVCGAATREAMLAEAARATVQAGQLQLQIQSSMDRGDREALLVYNSYQSKIKAALLTQDRDTTRYDREARKIPALEAAANQTLGAYDSAESVLNQCMSNY